MLKNKTRYALKVLQALTRKKSDSPVLIADLAAEENISHKFLEQILFELKSATLLKSRKGRGGGYMLARSAAKITVGEVIRLVEGPIALVPCVSMKLNEPCEECKDPNICGLKVVMKKVRDTTAEILDSTSIQDLVDMEYNKSKEKTIFYEI